MKQGALSSVPWSFWAIGAIALSWNVLGGINFFSQMDADAITAMPEPYRAIIEDRPGWATGTFAVAVFGGALGSLLLLLRKAAAYYLFIASLLGGILTIIQFHNMAGFNLPGALIGSLAQLLIGMFLIWYSKRAERKGWFREAPS